VGEAYQGLGITATLWWFRCRVWNWVYAVAAVCRVGWNVCIVSDSWETLQWYHPPLRRPVRFPHVFDACLRTYTTKSGAVRWASAFASSIRPAPDSRFFPAELRLFRQMKQKLCMLRRRSWSICGTHEDERTELYKTKSLNGTKPNTNPNTKTKTNPNPKLTHILTLFSCAMLSSSTVLWSSV